MNTAPVMRDIVLVGGGHTHALVIRHWAMRPLAGVRLTLVSEDTLTPYSGLLPGLLAGHQTPEEAHIDLRRLSAWADVRFIEARMTSIDPDRRRIGFAHRPSIEYDIASLDTGSTPDLSIDGAAVHATPVKPVHGLQARWQTIRERIDEANEVLDVGVVGAGAGGFELVMAIRHALPGDQVRCHWFLRGEEPLEDRPPAVRRRALAAARQRGVEVHAAFEVVVVRADGVEASDGRFQPLEETLWCTGATAPTWTRSAGFDVDDRGFVLTGSGLQSLSHPDVFAVGDIGTQRDSPSPKAGVFAVRQAPVLERNLRRAILGEALERYRPQRGFLSLMGTGDRNAIGNRGPITVEGEWVWRLKQWIDLRFMDRFAVLPPMPTRRLPPWPHRALVDRAAPLLSQRCQGCGGKVAASVIDSILDELQVRPPLRSNAGQFSSDDAVVLPHPNATIVQSVDSITAIMDDPWSFGRVAALHAISDVLTSGAEANTAQVWVGLPVAAAPIQRRELQQLMHGLVQGLSEESCQLVGGHTAEADSMTLGLVINAIDAGATVEAAAVPALVTATEERLAVVLTQALGTGLLFAGQMRALAQGVDVRRAIEAMLTSNRIAADLLRAAGSRGMTDVTGFGLLGHLLRLLAGSPWALTIDLSRVPVLEGARELAEAGVESSLLPANRAALSHVDSLASVSPADIAVVCDPQTSGGLVAFLPEETAEHCCRQLAESGYSSARIIGHLDRGDSGTPRHRLLASPSTVPQPVH